MRSMTWLPEPPAGTSVVLGFDGSETGDWTPIKAETVDGLLFTPRRPGQPDVPAIWDPSQEPSGRIPRHEVDATVDRLVQAIVANGPQAVRAGKRLISEVAGQPLTPALRDHTARHIADIRASEEGRAGLHAFLNKTAPAWQQG